MDKTKREAIEKRLAKLAEISGGRLTPDAVLADAKSKASPLHDAFTWDDSEAGQQWRLHQARELIRSVRVEVVMEARTVSTVRYCRDPSAGSDEQGYVEVAKLRDSMDLAREALHREIASVNALLSRVNDLAEVLGLLDEVRVVRESFDRLEARLAA